MTPNRKNTPSQSRNRPRKQVRFSSEVNAARVLCTECVNIARNQPVSTAAALTNTERWLRATASPMPMNAVYTGCCQPTRITRITTSASRPLQPPSAYPRQMYRTFSVAANPSAAMPAYTMPSRSESSFAPKDQKDHHHRQPLERFLEERRADGTGRQFAQRFRASQAEDADPKQRVQHIRTACRHHRPHANTPNRSGSGSFS